MEGGLFFKITVPIYHGTIYFAISDKREWCAGRLPRVFSYQKETLPNSTSNGTTFGTGSYQLIWLQRKDAHGVIAHEIFHAVNHIMDRAGIKLSYDSEEAYAYLTGYITEAFYSRLVQYSRAGK